MAIVAEVKDEELEIIGMGQQVSRGLKKAIITDNKDLFFVHFVSGKVYEEVCVGFRFTSGSAFCKANCLCRRDK